MTYFQLSVKDIVHRLRWVMLLVMVTDMVCTISGQPADYWRDHNKVNEIEPVTRFLLARGFFPYAIGAILYVVGAFCIVSLTPTRFALVILFAFLLAHFWGASSWLLYRFHYGVRSQNLFEIGIAALVTLAFGKTQKRSVSPLP